jgi:hypothetical protein
VNSEQNTPAGSRVGGARLRRAEPDHTLVARVEHTVPLLYDSGGDPLHDLPPHVRSGSGLARVGPQTLAIVQDDTNWITLVETRGFSTRAVPLPVGPGGARLFDDDRGTKHLKLDLESSVAFEEEGGVTLCAFGSGSSPMRESVVVVRNVTGARRPNVRIQPMHAFYGALRATSDFAGSEMNVEGALLEGGTLRLFNRGNGRPKGDRLPVDASCDIDWAAFLAHLATPDSTPAPEVRNIVQFELGDLDGVRLSLTDAALHHYGTIFVAAAEDSPDVVLDGPVVGSVVGLITDQRVIWTRLVDQAGQPMPHKIEGIATDPTQPDRVYLIADHDEIHRASDLLIVSLQANG